MRQKLNFVRDTLFFGLSSISLFGCGSSSSSISDGLNSELAVGVVSGAINNNNADGNIAYKAQVDLDENSDYKIDPLLKFLNPIAHSKRTTITCTGGTFSPTYNGSGASPYTFTPRSCTISWGNSTTTSLTWNSTFTLTYSSSCDSTHANPNRNTGAGCIVTRTTETSGNTRTFTNKKGNSFSVTYNTNGANTGWDSAVSPSPTNEGVKITCGANGCAGTSGSRNIVINGSNIKGTKNDTTVYDHTVSTGSGGLSIEGSGTSRKLNGTVTVQHNLAKYTVTTTFKDTIYGDEDCCFPTSGSVTTTTQSGGSETLTFSSSCGEATLTQADGKTTSEVTLEQCL